MAVAAAVPFCSCLHGGYVKAVATESLAGANDCAFGSAQRSMTIRGWIKALLSSNLAFFLLLCSHPASLQRRKAGGQLLRAAVLTPPVSLVVHLLPKPHLRVPGSGVWCRAS